MTPRFNFLIFSLIATIAVSSCAPAVTSTPAASIAPATVAPKDLSTLPVPETTIVPPTQAVEVLPVATSRGPNLEATDPTTVNLASGQLQLVEFFRFT